MGLAVGDFNSDGRLDILKTHFADDIPALYRGLGDGTVRRRGHARAAQCAEPARRVGRGDARSRQRRPAGHLLRHRQRLSRRSNACCRSTRTAVRESCFRTSTASGSLDVSAVERAGRGAAFEPRRRVRRHRQRRRHRRPGDEHERAAVAASQRLRGLERLDLGAAPRCADATAHGIGAVVAVTAGGRTQAQAVLSQASYYSHNDVRLHFGLGARRSRGAHRGSLAERRVRHDHERQGRTSRHHSRGKRRQERTIAFGTGPALPAQRRSVSAQFHDHFLPA